MAIIFGGDAGIREDSFGNFINGITGQFNRLVDGVTQLVSLEKIAGIDMPLPKENVYVDDGFQNVPGTSFVGSLNLDGFDDLKTRRITTQAPEFTVYVKKRLFSSLRNEHDNKFMDEGERLFMRASKLLFERKCTQIAAYEALTKIDRLIQEESEWDATLIETVINTLQDFLDTNVNDLENAALRAIEDNPESLAFQLSIGDSIEQIGQDSAKLKEALEALRSLAKNVRRTKQEINTTWVVDPDAAAEDLQKTGRGSGVIELTLVDAMNTNLSTRFPEPFVIGFTPAE